MKKLRKSAKEMLHAANKIYHYRRDVIPEGRLVELEKAVEEVQSLMEGDHPQKLEAAMDRLDGLLKKIGGKMYPKTIWNDNLEVALVAAIIVIGIRTFFFQPFIIPTNSMYPTYSGMNAVVYQQNETAGAPSGLQRFFRLATLGARHRALVAENSGPVELPFLGYDRSGQARFLAEPVPGRKFLVLPTTHAQYTVLVDGTPHKLVVPMEFASEMNVVLGEIFDPERGTVRRIPGNDRHAMLRMHQEAAAGDELLRFDITLGDALFVDRMSYHFRKPKVGDPFVFRTDQVQQEIGRFSGDFTNKYYIKRLAGVGGETLEIRDGTLLVDGRPRDEKEIFERIAAGEGEYGGYVNTELLGEGQQMKIPAGKFHSLGDNSSNSLDSRYWGNVPKESVIGKAFFIYYPFTSRWGPAE